MPRKHLFPLVVILAAAAIAGMLALSRTLALGGSASASTGSDGSVAFRLKELDRFEQSLRQQLAATQQSAGGTTVYRHATPKTASVHLDVHGEDEDHGDDEHEDDGRDD